MNTLLKPKYGIDIPKIYFIGLEYMYIDQTLMETLIVFIAMCCLILTEFFINNFKYPEAI